MNTVVERIIREEVREYLSAYFGASKSAPRTPRKQVTGSGMVHMHSPVIDTGLDNPIKKTMVSKIADMKTGDTLRFKFEDFVEKYNRSNSSSRYNGDRANWLADTCRRPACHIAKTYGRKYTVSKSDFEVTNTVCVTRLR